MKNMIRKIAIFRALHLGDLLCAMPAIRLLRETFPEAEITLIGLKGARELVGRYGDIIDRLMVFPGFPGLPEQSVNDPEDIIRFMEQLREYAFDIVIQLQGNGQIVNLMLLFSGAKYLWAFHEPEPQSLLQPALEGLNATTVQTSFCQDPLLPFLMRLDADAACGEAAGGEADAEEHYDPPTGKSSPQITKTPKNLGVPEKYKLPAETRMSGTRMSGWPKVSMIPYPEHLHESRRHLALVEYALTHFFKGTLPGEITGDDRLFYPLYEQDYKNYDQLLRSLAEQDYPLLQKDGYVVMHTASRDITRMWPGEYFAMAANYCTDKGLVVVFTGTKGAGPRGDEMVNDAVRIEQIQQQMRTPEKSINLAGKTDLGTVGILIKNAALVFSNCTGVSHITAGLAKPAVIISMDGAPHRWGPLDTDRVYTHDWTKSKDLEPIFMALAKKLEKFGKNEPLKV